VQRVDFAKPKPARIAADSVEHFSAWIMVRR